MENSRAVSNQTIVMCAITLSLAATAAGQSAAAGASPIPSLPPVGLAASETVQVNVVNTAVSPSTGVPASCTGSITFYNAGGTAIGAPANFSLGTRQIFSAALPYALTGGTGGRTVVRAEIATAATVAGFAIPPCILLSSLETYDTATGVTHTFAQGNSAQGVAGIILSGPPAVVPSAR
jgi:hypothetical protein